MNLIKRMRLWQRFAALGILGALLVAPPLYFYAREANKAIDAARLEQRGVKPVTELLHLLRLVQQHRGLSAGALGGNSSMQSQRAAKQAEVQQSFAKVEEVLKREIAGTDAYTGWQATTKSWTELAAAISNAAIRAPESFTRHTAIVEELLKLGDLLIDQFGLSLDPDAETFHLINAVLLQAPLATEELGKARARGAAVLTQKTGTAEERSTVSALIEKARAREHSMVNALTKAMAANPLVAANLGALFLQQVELSKKAHELAIEHIIKPEQLTLAAGDYFAAFTSAIDAYFALSDAAVASLEHVLEARVTRLTREKYTLIGVVGFIAVLAALTGIAVARSILRGLGGEPEYASEIVHKIADGDLTVTVQTKAGDDVSLLAAMKRMQDSLQGTVREITESSRSIATASSQIAAGNADLSQRTEDQAS
jgi:methyl-accepting chemotaxis protein